MLTAMFVLMQLTHHKYSYKCDIVVANSQTILYSWLAASMKPVFHAKESMLFKRLIRITIYM